FASPMRKANGEAATPKVKSASIGGWSSYRRRWPNMLSRTKSRISSSSTIRRDSGRSSNRCCPATTRSSASSTTGPRCSLRRVLGGLADTRRSFGRRDERRQCERQSTLRAQQFGEHGREIVARARIAPKASVGAKMKAAGARRDPQLAVRHVTIDDQLAPVGAFDFEDAIVQVPVDVGTAGFERGIECQSNRRQCGIGGSDKLGLGRHGGLWIGLLRV